MEANTASIGVGLFPYERWGGLRRLVTAVRHAEELGFAAVHLPEHLAIPRSREQGVEQQLWYDSMTLAAVLAENTTKIRLVLSALVLPLRHPVDTAKRLATLDHASNGRLTVVVGTGWLRREFSAMGVPYDERGARTDEYLRAMKTLWTEDEPHFEGRWIRFSGIAALPRCLQSPHVPLWIGGTCGKARPLARAAQFGDGWAPMCPGGAPMLRRDADVLKARLAEQGRDASAFRISTQVPVDDLDALTSASLTHVTATEQPATAPASHASLPQRLAEFREAGATDLTLLFGWATPDDYRRKLDHLAVELL